MLWAAKAAEFTFAFVAFCFIVFMVFQVVVPILKGTQIFPFLYPERKKALNKLTAAREEYDVNAIKGAANVLRNASTKPQRR